MHSVYPPELGDQELRAAYEAARSSAEALPSAEDLQGWEGLEAQDVRHRACRVATKAREAWEASISQEDKEAWEATRLGKLAEEDRQYGQALARQTREAVLADQEEYRRRWDL